jgi:A/G-specific adenine glycosylase
MAKRPARPARTRPDPRDAAPRARRPSVAPGAPAPDPAFAAAFDRALTSWFARHARDLPWRRDRSAYRVWVSEVMLQQTRVATVIAYFERFLARFPDLPALASASEADVLALWSGLGYYRRARGLHRGAREVVERFGGELPRSAEQLRTLRGIGAYTAGAVASLAFGERTPLVDGNVMRVYARAFALDDDIKTSAAQRRFWAIAASMVEHARAPGAFNEALMELGATVCVPRDPLCLVCPVRAHCRAFAAGRQNALPVVGAKRPVPEVHAAALVARRGGDVLLGRRRGDALFGGLWEPPMVEAPDAEAARAAVSAIAPSARAVGHVRHVLSHRRLEVTVLAGRPGEGATFPPLYEAVAFVPEADLGRYGVSTLARKLLAAAAAGDEPAPPPKRARALALADEPASPPKRARKPVAVAPAVAPAAPDSAAPPALPLAAPGPECRPVEAARGRALAPAGRRARSSALEPATGPHAAARARAGGVRRSVEGTRSGGGGAAARKKRGRRDD